MKQVFLGCASVFVVLFVLPTAIVGTAALFNGKVEAETDLSKSTLRQAPPEAWPSARKLKLVTFNVQALWVVGPKRPERMRGIAAKMAELDPDVAGFQEAFVPEDRDLLTSELTRQTRLQHHHYFRSATVGSGLLVSSAFPIEEAFFHRYTASNPWYKVWEGDWWAGKGVGLCRLALPDGGHIDFYNTHAQAAYLTGYTEVRVQQMTELARFINESRTGTAPAFLVGDMNCGKNRIDYAAVIDGAGLERVMNIQTRIDHIFWANDPRYRTEVLETIKIPRLSDHNGYISELRITPVETSSLHPASNSQ